MTLSHLPHEKGAVSEALWRGGRQKGPQKTCAGQNKGAGAAVGSERQPQRRAQSTVHKATMNGNDRQ